MSLLYQLVLILQAGTLDDNSLITRYGCAINRALAAQRSSLRLPSDSRQKPLRQRGPKGGDMVDIRGWLLSIVIGLGFWAFVSVCLSLLIR